ncbi:hypothetical protein NDU88_006009 [Pleurodeles waltl]|uniref:Uncharacterized protein n=1 Tax=Pleurodeles waltl TaxID=8319 RepID=A0AAV7NTW8_PLEWA|nr:hypothetical protein NDU88_006009 [Pleurodeles waltl]
MAGPRPTRTERPAQWIDWWARTRYDGVLKAEQKGQQLERSLCQNPGEEAGSHTRAGVRSRRQELATTVKEMKGEVTELDQRVDTMEHTCDRQEEDWTSTGRRSSPYKTATGTCSIGLRTWRIGPDDPTFEY